MESPGTMPPVNLRRANTGREKDGHQYLHAISEQVRKCLESEDDVLAAYVFGSMARGKSGPLSDIDVAVLLKPQADFWSRRLDLLTELGRALGDKADLVVLNEATVDLAYRVLRDGILLVSKDEKVRIEHLVRTVDRYLDMEPFRATVARGLSNRIREGKFGRH